MPTIFDFREENFVGGAFLMNVQIQQDGPGLESVCISVHLIFMDPCRHAYTRYYLYYVPYTIRLQDFTYSIHVNQTNVGHCGASLCDLCPHVIRRCMCWHLIGEMVDDTGSYTSSTE